MYCIIVLFAVYYLLCTSVHMYWLVHSIQYVRVYICTGTLVRGATEEVSAMDGSDGWMEYAYACTSARGGS